MLREAAVGAFASAGEAGAAASDAQAALTDEPWADAVIRVRMGLQAVGLAPAAAVVDGYFEARGRSRDGYDLIEPIPTDVSSHGEHRRLGAAMSAEEVVDVVLDELAAAPLPVGAVHSTTD